MDDAAPTTRERIVATAADLFLHHGYNGTGVNQILKGSGLSKGAFYHHFKSKDEIYLEVISGFFLAPFEHTDFDALAKMPLRDMRMALSDYYKGLPQEVSDKADIDMARYFALFFEAISLSPQFRKAVQSYYLTLIEVFTQRTYDERQVFAKVAEAHSRQVIAALEGQLFLNAILGDLAPLKTDETASELRRLSD